LMNHDDLQALSTEMSSRNEVLRRVLSELMGHLRTVASSKDMAPWWSPFSRKHRVRRVFRNDLRRLEKKWYDVLDDETIKTTEIGIIQQVKQHIKRGRNKFWLRCRQRWRAGLSYIHSPDAREISPDGSTSTLPTVKMYGQDSLASVAEHKRSQTSKNEFHYHKKRKCVPVILDDVASKSLQSSLRERSDYCSSVHRRIQSDRSAWLLNDDTNHKSQSNNVNRPHSGKCNVKQNSTKKKKKNPCSERCAGKESKKNVKSGRKSKSDPNGSSWTTGSF
jgi:hypothetical protein